MPDVIFYTEGTCKSCGAKHVKIGLKPVEIGKCLKCGSDNIKEVTIIFQRWYLERVYWYSVSYYFKHWLSGLGISVQRWIELRMMDYRELLQKIEEIFGFNPFEIDSESGRVKALIETFLEEGVLEVLVE